MERILSDGGVYDEADPGDSHEEDAGAVDLVQQDLVLSLQQDLEPTRRVVPGGQADDLLLVGEVPPGNIVLEIPLHEVRLYRGVK